jgi:hypothetical protein
MVEFPDHLSFLRNVCKQEELYLADVWQQNHLLPSLLLDMIRILRTLFLQRKEFA